MIHCSLPSLFQKVNMKIFLNNSEESIHHKASLEDLLKKNSLQDKKGIAVALNDCVISKNQWQNTVLNENDKVLVISATRGG